MSSQRPGFRDSLDALRSAQKPMAGTAAYSRHVNRPLGRVVAAAAHPRGITPDQATAVSALMSAAAIVLLALAEPSVVVALAVAVLLAGGYVLDSVDGQLARLRGGGSKRGEWLDHTVDCVKTSTLHLAVLVAWYRHPVADDDRVLLIPLAFTVVAATTFFGQVLVPTMRPGGSVSSTLRSADRPENPLRRWLLLPFDYGVVCWSFLLMAWPTAWLAGYAFLLAAAAGVLVLAVRGWWRELSRLDARAAAARADDPAAGSPAAEATSTTVH